MISTPWRWGLWHRAVTFYKDTVLTIATLERWGVCASYEDNVIIWDQNQFAVVWGTAVLSPPDCHFYPSSLFSSSSSNYHTSCCLLRDRNINKQQRMKRNAEQNSQIIPRYDSAGKSSLLTLSPVTPSPHPPTYLSLAWSLSTEGENNRSII